MQIELTQESLQNLETFAPLLNKDASEMINEALQMYFEEAAQKIAQEQNSETNLSYEEFWDDFEI